MIFEKQLSSLMTAALLCGTLTPFSIGQAGSAGRRSGGNSSGGGPRSSGWRGGGCSFGKVNPSSHRR